MEFGMFHEFPSLPGRTESEAFDEAMEQVDAAERLGLDVMWLAELHFEPWRSVLSAPLSIASAIAARTRHIKIGIAVQVLPLCHPLRLAEEAATVDQLSHGRLIFGVGRSGVAQTYEAYGVSYAESRDRFREILDILERAWTEPSFSYEGTYHRFNNVAVIPKPYQKPTPPIRIAASTPDTFPAKPTPPTRSAALSVRLPSASGPIRSNCSRRAREGLGQSSAFPSPTLAAEWMGPPEIASSSPFSRPKGSVTARVSGCRWCTASSPAMAAQLQCAASPAKAANSP